MLLFQVVTVFLVAVAMALALAHALEFPGKMRLSKANYIATQSIYYPGFTVGGFGEGFGMLGILLLLILTPRSSPAFAWIALALLALVGMHAVFWIVTQPVNKYWLADTRLTDAAERFFSVDPSAPAFAGEDQWERLRDRWEYSHLARAILGMVSLISITVAVAIYRQ